MVLASSLYSRAVTRGAVARPRGDIRKAGNRIKHPVLPLTRPPGSPPPCPPDRARSRARPLARPNTALHSRLPTRPLAVSRDGARSTLGKLTFKLRTGWWKPPGRWPNPPGGRSPTRLPARLVGCVLDSMSVRPPTRLPARMPACSTALPPPNQPARWPTRPSARPPALRPARVHHPFRPHTRSPARLLARPLRCPPARSLARATRHHVISPDRSLPRARPLEPWETGATVASWMHPLGENRRGSKATWNASVAAMLARAWHAVA